MKKWKCRQTVPIPVELLLTSRFTPNPLQGYGPLFILFPFSSFFLPSPFSRFFWALYTQSSWPSTPSPSTSQFSTFFWPPHTPGLPGPPAPPSSPPTRPPPHSPNPPTPLPRFLDSLFFRTLQDPTTLYPVPAPSLCPGSFSASNWGHS